MGEIHFMGGGSLKKAIAVLFVFVLSACAFDVVRVKQIPAQLETGGAGKSSFVLEKELNVNLDTGYKRKLKVNTNWTYAGTISLGDVFRTGDQVLTVEGSNIHEAYIVVSSGKLVGFYLPVERTFCPLSEQKSLAMGVSKNQ
jgi:hypothetical protein